MAEGSAEQLENLKLNTAMSETDEGDFVDPWKVQSSSAKGVDYDKLISMSIIFSHNHLF